MKRIVLSDHLAALTLGLLVLGILGAAALCSCATTSGTGKQFGGDFGACMQKKGIQALAGVESQGLAILEHGTSGVSVVDGLEALAGKAGLDTINCLVDAWLDPSTPLRAARPAAGVAGCQAFRAKHASPPAQGVTRL